MIIPFLIIKISSNKLEKKLMMFTLAIAIHITALFFTRFSTKNIKKINLKNIKLLGIKSLLCCANEQATSFTFASYATTERDEKDLGRCSLLAAKL